MTFVRHLEKKAKHTNIASLRAGITCKFKRGAIKSAPHVEEEKPEQISPAIHVTNQVYLKFLTKDCWTRIFTDSHSQAVKIRVQILSVRLSKDLMQHPGAILEDPPHITPHEQAVYQPAARRGIAPNPSSMAAYTDRHPDDQVNNEFYDQLGERWYAAQDNPVALLRPLCWECANAQSRSYISNRLCGGVQKRGD